MNKTKIPWCDYTINPVKGLCLMACPYCYARKMYKRFKWPEEISFHSESLDFLNFVPAGSRVFVGSTIDLFHKDTIQYLPEIKARVRLHPSKTFIFLTKCPQNLPHEWPDNCWVGVSATDFEMYGVAGIYLPDIKARVKFLSFEPLLARITDKNAQYNSEMMAHDLKFAGINWLILGSRTQPTQHPSREWVEEIITAADKAKIPVFVKEPMASHFNIHRQEWPIEKE